MRRLKLSTHGLSFGRCGKNRRNAGDLRNVILVSELGSGTYKISRLASFSVPTRRNVVRMSVSMSSMYLSAYPLNDCHLNGFSTIDDIRIVAIGPGLSVHRH